MPDKLEAELELLAVEALAPDDEGVPRVPVDIVPAFEELPVVPQEELLAIVLAVSDPLVPLAAPEAAATVVAALDWP